MQSRRFLYLAPLVLMLLATSWAEAGIVDNVRIALMRNNFAGAEAQLNSYRTQRGVDATAPDRLLFRGGGKGQ